MLQLTKASRIKIADLQDVPAILSVTDQVIQDSPYSLDGRDKDHIEVMIRSFIEQDDRLLAIIIEDEEIVGLILGSLMPHVFDPDYTVCHEHVWWVRDDKRKSRYGYILLKTLEEWAKHMGAGTIAVTHYADQPRVGKLLTRCEYTPREITYTKEIK